MKYTYLLIDLFTVILPLIFSFHSKLYFYKNPKARFGALAIAGVVFILCDSLFTYLGVWGFNSRYITGIHIGNLPLEEVLFFICIPFACIFTYESLRKQVRLNDALLPGKIIHLLLMVIFVGLAVYYHDRAYTVFTFALLAVLLFCARYILKVRWLLKFYMIYAILLVPFLIVNGLLTGTGLAGPVVWYNVKEMIGIRILTIPVEDIFYGMALILLNLMIYSASNKKDRRSLYHNKPLQACHND